MFSYEVTCGSCKRKFKLLEGSRQYKLFKEREVKIFNCEDCNHKIRMDAIKNFFR